MKKRFERNEIVARLRDTIATGKPIIGAGCSAGLIARAAELGGADVIICYSTGQSRIRGLQTVNIDHANPQTLSMYDEISNVVRDTPIIAGVEACDQTFYDLDELCRRFVDQGYEGVIIVGALDTKGRELAFVKDLVEQQGLAALAVDFGILGEPTN